jgi:oligopeptide/dipeptide ABC transporter ATP-binding protein
MPYTQALMDSIPRLADPSGTRLHAIAGRPPDLIHPPKGCRFAPRCPYVQDKCRENDPPLRTAASSDHLFACWFPLVNGVSTAPTGPDAPAAPDRSDPPSAPGATTVDPGGEVSPS